MLDLPGKKTGIFGLSFKENTDDLRESPVVVLLERLIGKGSDVRVFDPHIRIDDIYGANRNFIMESIPHIGRLMVPKLEEVLGWADQIVVTQKPAPELATAIRSSGLPVFDLACAMSATPNTLA